jgi:hypothetical protein
VRNVKSIEWGPANMPIKNDGLGCWIYRNLQGSYTRAMVVAWMVDVGGRRRARDSEAPWFRQISRIGRLDWFLGGAHRIGCACVVSVCACTEFCKKVIWINMETPCKICRQ